MNIVLVLFAVAGLSGCQSPKMTAADVQKCTVVNDVPAKHERHVEAPTIGGPGFQKSCLRALLREGNVAMYSLEHLQAGWEWSDLKSATDGNGRSLAMERVMYGTSGTSKMRNEVVRVQLLREDLASAARAGGLIVHLHGDKKSVDVQFPAYYVEGFLARVDATGW